MTPARGDRRIGFLDALRGVAILGILPVNAAFFAYPADLAGDPGYPPGAGTANAVCVHAVRLLFEDKFLTLFAVLFGVGLHLLRRGVQERGERWGPVAGRRLVFLWILGCLHGLLVWYGDILAYYGLLGFALAWAAGRPPEALRRWGWVLLSIPLLPLLGVLAGAIFGGEWVRDGIRSMFASGLPDGRTPGWEPGAWRGFGEQLLAFDPDFEIAVYRDGSLAQAIAVRGVTWAGAAVIALPYWGPRMAGLMLLGMAIAAEGTLLDPASEEGARRHRRLLRIGLAVGVPCSLAAAALWTLLPRDPVGALLAQVAQYAGSLGLAAAGAAFVALATASRPGAAWVRAAADIGRTALSNYLLQSMAMTILFYGTTVFLGAGCGLFAMPGRPALLALCAALLLAQVAMTRLWLWFFPVGPAEWLWRAVTHLSPRFPGHAPVTGPSPGPRPR